MWDPWAPKCCVQGCGRGRQLPETSPRPQGVLLDGKRGQKKKKSVGIPGLQIRALALFFPVSVASEVGAFVLYMVYNADSTLGVRVKSPGFGQTTAVEAWSRVERFFSQKLPTGCSTGL